MDTQACWNTIVELLNYAQLIKGNTDQSEYEYTINELVGSLQDLAEALDKGMMLPKVKA